MATTTTATAISRNSMIHVRLILMICILVGSAMMLTYSGVAFNGLSSYPICDLSSSTKKITSTSELELQISSPHSRSRSSPTDANSGPTDLESDFDSSLNLDDSELFPLHSFGYIPSRIKFKDMNFCDIGYSGMPRNIRPYGPITCIKNDELDPTCEKCLEPDSLEKYETIWNTYEKNATTRRHMLQEELLQNKENNNNKGVVIVMSNKKYLYMAKNWWCHASQNGLDQRNVIMYALDDETAEWAKSQGMHTLHPSLYAIEVPEKIESGFKWVLFPLLADLLHMGYHVLFNDVDLLWTSNLQQNMQSLWKDIPLVTQVAPRWDTMGVLNSGILSLRPTPQMKVFVETLMETIPIFLGLSGGSDQRVWNHLLRHHKFMTLPWRTLPHQLVVNAGVDKKMTHLSNQTWCIHWVGMKGQKSDTYSSVIQQKC